MKDLVKSEKGIVYISVILISLIIFVILTSLVYLINNNIRAVISNNDNYKANYIVESNLDLKIMEITEISDKCINEYLLDLRNYKIKYIEERQKDASLPYDPPRFSTYINDIVIPDVENLSGTIYDPFEEYKDKHSFHADIKYNYSNKVVDITAVGTYRRARVFINVKLELPKAIENGVDEYNLPKINILPVNIIEYYQTFGV